MLFNLYILDCNLRILCLFLAINTELEYVEMVTDNLHELIFYLQYVVDLTIIVFLLKL